MLLGTVLAWASAKVNRTPDMITAEREEQPEFVWCEPVSATPYTHWHIRVIKHPEDIRTGGGIPHGTLSLCRRNLSYGWDVLLVRSNPDPLAQGCAKCIDEMEARMAREAEADGE